MDDQQDFLSFEQLTAATQALIAQAQTVAAQYATKLAITDPRWRNSAENLLHYLALRSQDIRSMQQALGHLGLSRLGRAESHVMASLQTVSTVLHRLQGLAAPEIMTPISIAAGPALVERHAEDLMGPRSPVSQGRVMVTMPNDAAERPDWLGELMQAGMSVARINCAKGNADHWANTIGALRAAAQQVEQPLKICMDLAGPKLRTGAIHAGVGETNISLRKLSQGEPQPARVWLAPEPNPAIDYEAHLPVSTNWTKQVQPGDLIGIVDTQRRQVQLWIQYTSDGGCLALSQQPLTVHSGTTIRLLNRPVNFTETRIGKLPIPDPYLLLNPGDRLHLTREPIAGEKAAYDPEGNLITPAHISCTLPAIFDHVQPGQPIRFDDGKIEGLVRKVSPEELMVDITYTKPGGSKLRADKGINLPRTQLGVHGLTHKDREDLAFVVQHADIVSLSFVNSPQDVMDLMEALEGLGAQDLGVILKLETRQGVLALPAILLAAMRRYPIGVMVARGDLAVEVGWEELAMTQEEIVRMCEAAHVPTIWATQVLETMAKKGRPSRAEITDAARARQAECVMLNKGPYLLQALALLGTILKQTEAFQAKSAPMLPQLAVQWPETEN
jgi:pyruvate kinase